MFLPVPSHHHVLHPLLYFKILTHLLRPQIEPPPKSHRSLFHWKEGNQREEVVVDGGDDGGRHPPIKSSFNPINPSPTTSAIDPPSLETPYSDPWQVHNPGTRKCKVLE